MWRVAHLLLLLLFCSALASAQPYAPHAIWSREGAGDSSLYGSQILALGDQNDDGFNDFAVYASGLGYAPQGSPNEPKVEFFHGGNPPDTIPYMVRVKDPATEVAVRGAQAVGDLNGDGYTDWFIFTSYLGDSTAAHIYKIYFGGPGPHEVPDLVIRSLSCAPIGDFNGDGFDDLLLLVDAGSGIRRSQALAGGNPMDTLPDWTRAPILSVRGTRDVNGDHFSDFICDTGSSYGPPLFLGGSNPDTIPAYIFSSVDVFSGTILSDVNDDGYDEVAHGETGGASIIWGASIIDTSATWRLNFPCSGGGPGGIVSAGDFNHDGFRDIVMAAGYCENNYAGVLTLHLGGQWINPTPVFVIYGWTDPFNLIHFKTAVNLGDINGDHIDDLAIGANGGIEYAAQRGKVVILGGDSGLHAAADPVILHPSAFSLSVYPNPFNSSTTVELSLPAYSKEVNLVVYNLLGQAVSRAVAPVSAGTVRYRYDASALASGLYLLQVSSGSLQTTTKLMVLK